MSESVSQSNHLILYKMMRLCLATTNKVEATRTASGKWRVQGPGAEAYEEGMTIFMQLFSARNNSFYMSTSLQECVDRMKNNLSDWATMTLSFYRDLNHYTVPVPFLVAKIEMITGYNITQDNNDAQDTANVFTNLELLHFSYFIVLSCIMISFFIIIIWRVSFQLRYSVRRVNWTSGGRNRIIMKLATKHMSQVLLGESYHFRWIAFLCSLMLFSLVTSFNCLYKTSRVVQQETFVVKTYDELMEHPTAMPLFFNAVGNIVDRFRGKPASDIHGRIWSKIPIGREKEFITTAETSSSDFLSLLERIFMQMNGRKSVIFVPSTFALMVKTLLCGSSLDNEIWNLLKFVDPSESEEILGYGLSDHFDDPRYFQQRIRRGFESFLFIHYYTRALDVREIPYSLRGTKEDKKHKQNLVCDGEPLFYQQPEVHAISMRYFQTFIISLSCINLLALLALAFEKFSVKKNAHLVIE